MVCHRRKAIDEAFEISFNKQLFCKKRLHNVLIGSKSKHRKFTKSDWVKSINQNSIITQFNVKSTNSHVSSNKFGGNLGRLDQCIKSYHALKKKLQWESNDCDMYLNPVDKPFFLSSAQQTVQCYQQWNL